MPAIPSKSTREKVLAIASKFALASDYAHWKMHGEYSSGTVIEDDSPDAIFSDATPNNAPDWSTNPGWLTASTAAGGSGDNRTLTAAEKAFLDTHTLTGSIVIGCWIQVPDAISVADYIFSYGRTSDGDNYAFLVNSARKMNTLYGGSAKVGSTIMSPGARHHIGMVIDTANGQMWPYIDGVQDAIPVSITRHTATPVTQRYGFLLNANGASGASEFGENDTTTSNDILISDLQVFRFETDVSALFPSIITGLYTSQRGVIPEVMDGL